MIYRYLFYLFSIIQKVNDIINIIFLDEFRNVGKFSNRHKILKKLSLKICYINHFGTLPFNFVQLLILNMYKYYKKYITNDI